MSDGPAYTILDVQALDDGRKRVLVRKRGGRLIRFCVAANAANGPTITQMIEQVLPKWPGIPDPRLVEE